MSATVTTILKAALRVLIMTHVAHRPTIFELRISVFVIPVSLAIMSLRSGGKAYLIPGQ